MFFVSFFFTVESNTAATFLSYSFYTGVFVLHVTISISANNNTSKQTNKAGGTALGKILLQKPLRYIL